MSNVFNGIGYRRTIPEDKVLKTISIKNESFTVTLSLNGDPINWPGFEDISYSLNDLFRAFTGSNIMEYLEDIPSDKDVDTD